MASPKKIVLARFPTAKAVVESRWEDGSPRWYSVIVDQGTEHEKTLELFNSDYAQGATAAWADAKHWCRRNPVAPAISTNEKDQT